MNKYIFWLEGIDFLQVIRKNGLVEIYQLENNKIELESKYDLYLLRNKMKIKNKGILMFAREFAKSKSQEKTRE